MEMGRRLLQSVKPKNLRRRASEDERSEEMQWSSACTCTRCTETIKMENKEEIGAAIFESVLCR
jgi:hypothetical protein